MWDWDSGVAGDGLELIKEGLWAQTGSFDRQVNNVVRQGDNCWKRQGQK